MPSSSKFTPDAAAGQFGKPRIGDDVAERIRNQTAKNTEQLLRSRISELEEEIARMARISREAMEQLRAEHREQLDTLISYILNAGVELPEELQVFIGKNTEQRVKEDMLAIVQLPT